MRFIEYRVSPRVYQRPRQSQRSSSSMLKYALPRASTVRVSTQLAKRCNPRMNRVRIDRVKSRSVSEPRWLISNPRRREKPRFREQRRLLRRMPRAKDENGTGTRQVKEREKERERERERERGQVKSGRRLLLLS